MLYPRQLGDGKLVDDNQMVGHREHLSQEHRMIFLTGELGGETESHNLLFALDSLSHDPIKLVITSGGGILDSAFFFYDAIRLLQSPVYTLGRYCCSAAVPLLAAGEKRYLFPHAKVMLHLPSAQLTGDSRDLAIQQKQVEQYCGTIVEMLRECGVKKSPEEILTDIDREFWMTPTEAIAYGLADEIMDKETLGKWLS